MRVIIAAFEAKRAAAGIGAALLVVALACAGLVLAPDNAAAQGAGWTDPSGRVSLSYEALDWSAAPPSVAQQGGYLLMLHHNDMPRDRRPRVCTVLQRPQPQLGGGSQDQLNATLEGWTSDLLHQRLGAPVSNLRRLRLGGVAVLDYAVRMQGLDMHTRTFVLSAVGEPTLFDITCGVPVPATEDELLSMTSVLRTLDIRQPATSQGGVWVEPGGRFSLGFEALGWTAAPTLVRPPNILAIVRNDSPRDDRMRICFVREMDIPDTAGIRQQAANEMLDRWTDARVSEVVGRSVTNVNSFSRWPRGGD